MPPSQRNRVVFRPLNQGYCRRQCTVEAGVITDASPVRPFSILVSSSSNSEVHLPENMKIAHTAISPGVIHAVDTGDQNTTPIGTSDADVNSIDSEVIASSKVRLQHPGPHDITVVPYKPSKSRETEIWRTAVQKNPFYSPTTCRTTTSSERMWQNTGSGSSKTQPNPSSRLFMALDR